MLGPGTTSASLTSCLVTGPRLWSQCRCCAATTPPKRTNSLTRSYRNRKYASTGALVAPHEGADPARLADRQAGGTRAALQGNGKDRKGPVQGQNQAGQSRFRRARAEERGGTGGKPRPAI